MALGACFYILITTLWAPNVPPLDNFLYHTKRAVEICALIVLISAFFKTDYTELLFKVMVIVACVHAIILIPEQSLSTRLTNPIDTAMVYGIAATIALSNALKNKKLWVSIAYLIAFSILITILLLTKSRGPQIALLVTTCVIVFIHRRQIKLFITYLIVSISTILLFVDATKLFSRGLDFSMRDVIWKETVRESMQNFWFGFGMQKKFILSLPNGHAFTHSHNFILDTFRLTGFVGACLVVIVYLYALYRGFKSPIYSTKIWAVILLFGSLCLMSNGKIPFNRPSHSWLAFWIPIAMITNQPRDQVISKTPS
jgi:O-antigen ligase